MEKQVKKLDRVVLEVKTSRTGEETPEAMAQVLSSLTNLKKDRKSTRLNSSHQIISYAVFCLKKKKEDDLRSSARPVYNLVLVQCLLVQSKDNDHQCQYKDTDHIWEISRSGPYGSRMKALMW